MTAEMNPFSNDQLAERCAEEASRKDTKKRDDRFCFELVQRAFGLEDEDALGKVYPIYMNIWSVAWIRNPRQFDAQMTTAEDFVAAAFNKVYFDHRGSGFDKFEVLNAFLSFLHRAVIWQVAEHLRQKNLRHMLNMADMQDGLTDLLEYLWVSNDFRYDVEKQDLLRRIRERIHYLLPNEKDRHLVQCYANGMKRAEIVGFNSDWWKNENDVRVDWQRITRKLGNDVILHDLLRQLFNDD